ncbi:serine/threonine-protein kinase [Nannocystis bainbridge]|uniref:Serine/threonine-protein kinase n=1 Tax=Nannocystis bainbridge TaxID=2995303 RepID=A0ABT5DUJ0_9BACT|nr:serine/threonine-protein kinase [Nannocystis bainbridge]MDC0716087.1 serine/threonine-protein kinase [Nannocystis bainbridge]
MSTEPSAPPSPEGELSGLWIGRVIDERYRIVEVLGEGGMGAVFVAEHLKLRKLVALKTIRAEFAGDGQAEARFAREALATAQIDHPHVASAMDFGHLPDGGAYLVIQLVRGENLARRLERGPLPWRQVAELGGQIADALATCHAAGIIHRDLKPDNILLEQRDDGSFHARVVDFGIARLSGETGDGAVVDASQPITRMGAIIGTPGYMAPEQAVGQTIDQRVDIYALGVILWECTTGRRLWQGDSLTALFTRQLAGAAPALRDLFPGHVPEALSDLTAQLITADPASRPAQVAPIRDELRRLAFSGDAGFSTGPDLRGGAPISMSHAPTSGGWSTAGVRPEFSTPGGTLIAGPPGPPPLAMRLRALAIQRPQLVRNVAAALALLVLVLVYQCGRHSEPDPKPVVAAAEPEAKPAPSKPAKPGKVEAKPGKVEAKPEAEVEAPPEPEPAPEPAAPPVDLAEVPAAFVDAAQTLLTGGTHKARKKAAEAIARASEADKASIPEYVRNLAWLEKVSRCEDKRKVLLKLEEAGDLRALPGLLQVAKTPKNGCREWFTARDCIGCLREDLGRVIGRFQAQAEG